MINKNCPLCKDKEILLLTQYMVVSKIFRIVKCACCGHYYTYIDNEVDLEKLYEEGVYEVVENRGSIFDKILSVEGKHIFNRILAIRNGQKGRLLDFGCGKGKFLALTSEIGWDVMGVETSSNRSQYAKEIYKLQVIKEYYVTGMLDNERFNVITLFHVLEHIQTPYELLYNLVSYNLQKNGHVIIEVPNIKSIQAKIGKNKWLHLDVPKHLSHFDKNGLEELLKKINLTPIKIEYFSFHHGVLGMLDTLLCFTGYKKNIIYELKNNLDFYLIFKIILLLPFSLIIEILASMLKKGGVIRIYAIYNPKI